MAIWKRILNVSYYEVSDEGEVRSLDHDIIVTCLDGTSHVRRFKGKVLRPQSHPFGYSTVKISYGGVLVTRTIHSLVMEAHVGPCPDGMQIRHLDGDVKNARLDNLVYGTQLENEADKLNHGTDNRGSKHWNAKITPEQALEIRELRKTKKATEIAPLYGLSVDYIYTIGNKKSWRHL